MRLQLSGCTPWEAGSVEAMLSQHTLEVCLVDRLKLEKCQMLPLYTLCSPKTNLLDTLHILSVDTHTRACFFQPPKSSHPAPVVPCKALGCDGPPVFLPLARQYLRPGNRYTAIVFLCFHPVPYSSWCGLVVGVKYHSSDSSWRNAFVSGAEGLVFGAGFAELFSAQNNCW